MKKLMFVFLLGFVSLSLVACGQNTNTKKEKSSTNVQQQSQEAVKPVKDERIIDLSSDDFEQTLFADDSKENVILLDVRTPQEFEQGHIKGAINVDVRDKDFKENAAKVLKYNPHRVAPTVAVYCRSGVRSVTAANILLKEGYAKKVYNLEKGINGWMGEVVK